MKKSKKPKLEYQKLVLIVLFIFLGLILLNSSLRKGANKKNLERDYEVLDFRCSNQDLTFSIVKMKYFGNRHDQVWKGLIYLAGDCPSSERYSVTIVEENKECDYLIPGNIYGGYSGKEIINDTEIMNEPLYWDWESFVTGNMVNEVYEKYDIPLNEIVQYQKIEEEGVTKDVLFSIINNYIDRFPHCY